MYVCYELAKRPNIYGEYACKMWQFTETNSGDLMTPEITAQVIMFALVLNLVVFGFKSIKRVL